MSMGAVKALLTARTSFLVAVALGMVGLRVLIFDYRYFALAVVPNHDMHQGLAFFCTNMHSVRLTGELAWWSPMRENGYAQYYQAFFSPLAPTPHHLTFIAWAQLIRVLSWVGVAIPEYQQYLAVNFLVLPFLATLAFAAFAAQLFRRRATVLVVTLAWTLSGIGLWHSAWFYFQEPLSLYLLLAAGLAALRRPTGPRLLLLLAAALLQATSLNYWTVYNLFFVVILSGACAWMYPTRFRRLARRAAQGVMRHKRAAGVLSAAALAVLLIWGVLLGSIVREQNAVYTRQDGGPFTMKEAAERVQGVWPVSLGLFTPNLPRAAAPDQPPNVQHCARYLGCALLPLLVLLPALRWRRRERWLMLSAAGVLAVCLAPPLLLVLWKWIPMMDRIRHAFYFYSHHWQTLVVLLAGASLDTLLRHTPGPACRRPRWLLGGLCAALGLVLLVYGSFWHMFPQGDSNVHATLHVALLTLMAAAPVLQILIASTPRSRAALVGLLTVLLLADLSKYFGEVCEIDSQFTGRYTAVGCNPLSAEKQAAAARPWPDPDPAKEFNGAVGEGLPVRDSFWPVNVFLYPHDLDAVRQAPVFYVRGTMGPALSFFDSARSVQTLAEAGQFLKTEPAVVTGNRVVLVQDPAASAAQGTAPPTPAPPAGAGFSYRFRKWGYNAFDLDVTAPREGWVYVRQYHDPRWRVYLDGTRAHWVPAEFVGMAVRVGAGRHVLRLDYRPLARRLYWPACFLLEGALVLLLTAALRARRSAGACRSGLRLLRVGPEVQGAVPLPDVRARAA
jgi:hypothetical protein